jgi:hypothetical protein
MPAKKQKRAATDRDGERCRRCAASFEPGDLRLHHVQLCHARHDEVHLFARRAANSQLRRLTTARSAGYRARRMDVPTSRVHALRPQIPPSPRRTRSGYTSRRRRRARPSGGSAPRLPDGRRAARGPRVAPSDELASSCVPRATATSAAATGSERRRHRGRGCMTPAAPL